MRVVAGLYKGRQLKAPPGRGTRPTADRTREALYAILGDVAGAHVLDLFAGSGAMGIEALSRGAADATFVERDRRAAAVIEANLDALGAEARLVQADALSWLRTQVGKASFELVLIDPPYDSAPALGGRLSTLLPPILARDARVVTESDKRNPLILDLPLTDERTYGDTRIAIHSAGSS